MLGSKMIFFEERQSEREIVIKNIREKKDPQENKYRFKVDKRVMRVCMCVSPRDIIIAS